PEQQPSQGGLPAAGPAEDPEHPSRRDAERDVVQYEVLFVAERDRVELDAERARRKRAVPVDERGAGPEQLVDPAEARDGALHVLELAAERLDRASQELRVVEEEGDGADADRADRPEVPGDGARDGCAQ